MKTIDKVSGFCENGKRWVCKVRGCYYGFPYDRKEGRKEGVGIFFECTNVPAIVLRFFEP